MKRPDVITIVADGTTVTTAAASARVAIPNNSAGARPNYIRVSASAESYVRLGDASVVATANSTLIQPADAVIFAVGGATNIAHIQGAAPARVNIVPLEDF